MRNNMRPAPAVRSRFSAPFFRRRVIVDDSGLFGISAGRAQRIWKKLFYSLFFAIFTYGLITGGHISNGLGIIIDELDEIVREAGFGITNVLIVGQKRVSDNDILTVLDAKSVSLLRFDTQKARESIENLEWVASARVMRFFPSTIKVEIKERQPYALWQTKGQFFLIDTEGVVISEQKSLDNRIVGTYPLIVGDEADTAARQLFEELRKHPGTADRIKAALRVAKRRWTLQLQNGVEILLPEKGMTEALSRLSTLERQYSILSGHIKKIDLRLSDRITLRRYKNGAMAVPEKEKSYSQMHVKRSGA